MPQNRFLVRVLPAAALAALSAGMSGTPKPQPKAGDPIPDLSFAQRLLFDEGKEYYELQPKASMGFGPTFNARSCAACHETPLGGWGGTRVTRFGRVLPTGAFDLMEASGGPVLQRQAEPSCTAETVPPGTVTAKRATPSVLAFGLVEAIPDEALIALEDPDDRDRDGISGRAHRVHTLEDPTGPVRIGRFGWKSQIATVLSFSADAARNEMGLTNRVIPVETPANGVIANLGCDLVRGDWPTDASPVPEDKPDPKNGLQFIDAVTGFQRYLAPPPQSPRRGMSGERVFVELGCAKCHVPEFTTADDAKLESALRNRTIRPYSDFLLHDMGATADGFPEGEATRSEMRTPPLWNLRTRPVMMHDGETDSMPSLAKKIEFAVSNHGGEGEAARTAYLTRLERNPAEIAQLVAFLDSLGRDDYDANGDGVVDGRDLAIIAPRALTPGVHPDDPWAVADLDGNGTIDAGEMDQLQTLVTGGGVASDCNGNSDKDWRDIALARSLDADLDGVPDECFQNEACWLRQMRVSSSGPVNLPDQGVTRSSVTIPSEDPRATRKIKSLRLTLDIRHTWLQDISITLEKNGTAVRSLNLASGDSNRCGAQGDLFGTYVIVDPFWPGAGSLPSSPATLCQLPQVDRGAGAPDDHLFFRPGTVKASNAMFGNIRQASIGGTWSIVVSDAISHPPTVGGDPTPVTEQIVGWSIDFAYDIQNPLNLGDDCNGDGIPDCSQFVDSAEPNISDCDGDLQLDICQLIANPGIFDRDGDGRMDACELADPSSSETDCNRNGVLDRFEPDADGDGVPDVCDGCPNNRALIAPDPACACSTEAGDSDNDGVPNCNDRCPGAPDLDSDMDGTLDCMDGCPRDPRKVAPGVCGCDNLETDRDTDGTPDCVDECDDDPAKQSPGQCGCDKADTDRDGDGTADCNDLCPLDPLKTAPLTCGCGVTESDSDADGTPDCVDAVSSQAALLRVIDPTAPAAGGSFGAAMDTDAQSLVIGAPGELAGTTAAGAVYVLARSPQNGDWLTPQRVLAPAPIAGTGFGSAVAIAGDLMAVGAPLQSDTVGRVHVFQRGTSGWALSATLQAPDAAAGDRFGASVDIASGRVFVGCPGDDLGARTDAGSVRVFERVGANWSQATVLQATDGLAGDAFGTSVSADGETVAVAAPARDVDATTDRGAVLVFIRSDGNWSQQSVIAPTGATSTDAGFGASLQLRGERLLVGGPRFDPQAQADQGSAFVFVRSEGVWSQEAALTVPSLPIGALLGSSVSLDPAGGFAVLSAPADRAGAANRGSCTVFKRFGMRWQPLATLEPPHSASADLFGACVTMVGDFALVASPESGLSGASKAGRVWLIDSAPLDCDGDGEPDLDIDEDGIADCSDLDDDSDGFADAVDGCPGDPGKNAPGACGCFEIESDSDGDGAPDCVDECPGDRAKTVPGACGCGVADTDTDGDGTPDCSDSVGLPLGVVDASALSAGARYGWAIAADGHRAVVGAPLAVNVDSASRGLVKILARDEAGVWKVEATIPNLETGSDTGFGARVAIEGDTVVVGAPQARLQSGRCYVFNRLADGSWAFAQRLDSPDGFVPGRMFGASVAISGTTISVGETGTPVDGAARRGAVHVFVKSRADAWTRETSLQTPTGGADDAFGQCVVLRDDWLFASADFEDAGAISNAGAVHAFERVGSTWSHRARITAPSPVANARFGRNLAFDGTTLVANSPDSGSGLAFVYPFDAATGAIGTPKRLEPTETLPPIGFASNVAVHGRRLLLSDSLHPSAGVPLAGLVRVYEDQPELGWTYRGVLASSAPGPNDQFGWGLALSGDHAFAGAVGVDVGAASDAGAIYIFDLNPVDCDKNGTPDLDTDADGVADCLDADDDGDGTADAQDACPSDPLKVAPGLCGCGVTESPVDTDTDGVRDCTDNCPAVANPGQQDCDADGVGDACQGPSDCDADGTQDRCQIALNPDLDLDGNGQLDACQTGITRVRPGQSIQAAIDAAASGSVVLVEPGVYVGSVQVRGKVVKLRGLGGPANTVLDGAAVTSSVLRLENGPTGSPTVGPDTVVSGFTIRRGTQGTLLDGSQDRVGGGIFVNGCSPTIRDCVISQCRAGYGAGIYLLSSSSLVERCEIRNNAAIEDGGGLQAWGGAVTVRDCVLSNNVAGRWGGGLHFPTGSPTIADCLISDNVALSWGGGISWDSSAATPSLAPLQIVRTVVRDNFAVSAGGGARFWSTGSVQRSARLIDSEFCGNVPDEIDGSETRDADSVVCVDCNGNGVPDTDDVTRDPSLDCNHNGKLDECDLSSGDSLDTNANRLPDECETGSAAFVPGQFPTIQAAVDQATEGQIIWVAPGVHRGRVDLRGKSVTIRGAGEGVILDGSQLNESIVFDDAGVLPPPRPVLENLTFRNGRVGSRLSIEPTVRTGGAILSVGSAMTIRNCVFINCRSQYGGAAYMYTFEGVIENCEFRDNSAIEDGGALLMHSGRGVVRDCVFENNVATYRGGSVHLVNGTGYLLDNNLLAGGLSLKGYGGAISWSGGAGANPAPITLVDCQIEFNQAADTLNAPLDDFGGGGLYVNSSFPEALVDQSAFCFNLPEDTKGPWRDLGGTTFCNTCTSDLDGSDTVDFGDITICLLDFGPCSACPADVDESGEVDFGDLTVLLLSFGPCP